jgi:hypothetical protein
VGQSENVFAAPVADGVMRQVGAKANIAAVFVGGDKANAISHHWLRTKVPIVGLGFPQKAGDDWTLPLN